MLKTITINQSKDLADLEKIKDYKKQKEPLIEISNIGLIRLIIKTFWINEKNKKELE